MQNVIQLLQSGFAEKSVVFAHTQTLLVINVDKNTAYHPPVDDLKADEHLPEASELRQMGCASGKRGINSNIQPSPGFCR
ncbi:hypothetical protein BWI75_25055 [Gloeocapsopsis sp. AAB1 = 1H9]|uniref:Uncharacterized protein n=1 Tax=Gloeocapsopsis dulcis AAB1 = 1H9 TaxID=1433147 RepID=A0A6N8G301_9CHRO|nr:hypothetical protein [Gloeocapsopsis dulcis AAB1 = 1H9]